MEMGDRAEAARWASGEEPIPLAPSSNREHSPLTANNYFSCDANAEDGQRGCSGWSSGENRFPGDGSIFKRSSASIQPDFNNGAAGNRHCAGYSWAGDDKACTGSN